MTDKPLHQAPELAGFTLRSKAADYLAAGLDEGSSANRSYPGLTRHSLWLRAVRMAKKALDVADQAGG